MARLVLSGPEPDQWDVPADGRRLRLGRGAECEIQVDVQDVSRVHAAVWSSGGQLVIEDLGSSNGTFVNGEPVTRRALAAGDRIRLGRSADLAVADDLDKQPRGRRRVARWSLPRETQFSLQPLEGDSPAGEALPLSERMVTVGRDASAWLVLDDDTVSRLHARLDREGEDLWVTDLKSRNGTRVNGSPAFRARVGSGDIIAFGDLEFVVVERTHWAVKRIALAVVALVALVAVAFGIAGISERIVESIRIQEANRRARAQVLASIEKGVRSFERGERDFARSYFLYAADVLLLTNQVPRGVSGPREVLRAVARDLPAGLRDFDFATALDSAAMVQTGAELTNLSPREYVERQVRRITIDLGLDDQVPEGFVESVWGYVRESMQYRGKFQATLDRSPGIHPLMKRTLAEAHLPEVFCYVAWVESDLVPDTLSHAGALGLWQFMPTTAREKGLRVGPDVDERTDVAKSTRAAASVIAGLLKTFGPEQFMCALASYNRGDAGVRKAMMKIEDPMLESSKKFWYLVEQKLLPKETSEYVPRIIATRIMAEDPVRFGFRLPRVRV
jgi:pSer/pThr/pTyr-binding forkhead associated (FHA) protein